MYGCVVLKTVKKALTAVFFCNKTNQITILPTHYNSIYQVILLLWEYQSRIYIGCCRLKFHKLVRVFSLPRSFRLSGQFLFNDIWSSQRFLYSHCIGRATYRRWIRIDWSFLYCRICRQGKSRFLVPEIIGIYPDFLLLVEIFRNQVIFFFHFRLTNL